FAAPTHRSTIRRSTAWSPSQSSSSCRTAASRDTGGCCRLSRVARGRCRCFGQGGRAGLRLQPGAFGGRGTTDRAPTTRLLREQARTPALVRFTPSSARPPAFLFLPLRAVGDRSGGHGRVCRVLRVQRAVCDGSGSGARVCHVLHGPRRAERGEARRR